MYRLICWIVVVTMLLGVATPVAAQDVTLNGSLGRQPTVHRDLEFARVDGQPLLLDLHLPSGIDNPPLVVWVHGGAWRKGKKGVGRVAWMVDHGYALAGISYRLSQKAIFPAQIHDCKAAVRWLRAHSDKYGYDARRIGVAGSSAGGHLVALLGTSGGVESLEGNLGDALHESSAVQAVCDLWGPTDFLQMGGRHNDAGSPESQLIGGSIQEHADKAAVANPITYVDKNDPPFLLIHGDQDRAVPLNQSELLRAALAKAGVSSELNVLKGGGHGGRGYPVEKMNEMVLTFFEKHLKPIKGEPTTPLPQDSRVQEDRDESHASANELDENEDEQKGERPRQRVIRIFNENSPAIGQPLPDLTVFDADGNEFQLSNLRGQYSVLLFGCLT